MKIAMKMACGVLIFLFAACSKPQDGHFRLTAEYDHLHQADFYIYSDLSGFGRLDTLHVFRGEIEYEAPLTHPSVIKLQYPNFGTTTFVARAGESIEIEADVNDLQKMTISGNDDNEKLTQFRHSIVGKNKPAQEKMAREFIEKNASSLAALAVFIEYFVEKEELEYKDLPLLETIYKKQKKEPCVMDFYAHFKPILQHAKGAVVPEFAGDGEGYVLFTLGNIPSGNIMRYQLENRQRDEGVRFREIELDENPDSLIKVYGLRNVPAVVHVDGRGKILGTGQIF